MFNTSNHSSERSMRRESTHGQRGPSTQRSRSVRSNSSSRHSESKPQWKAPPWVHCEKCYRTDDATAMMMLLTCGHIFCRSCLCVDHSLLLNELVPCPLCKISVAQRPIDGSMDAKLHGMFQQSWTDPILKINLRHMQFMFTKTQNYSKYLSKSIKQSGSIPVEYVERYNNTKKTHERIQKLKKYENGLNAKVESLKAGASKRYKTVQALRSFYQRKKAESVRQPQQPQYQKVQVQNMKFVSSGRNEQTNPYIDRVKTSHWPTNKNQSAAETRNFSQKAAPAVKRHSTSLNQYDRESTSKQSSDFGARRPAMQSATFRPKPKDFASDNRRFEPQPHAQKRLVPSYDRDDEYPNPPKRAGANYAVRREINLDTSVSSVGSSQILNNMPYKPAMNYNNRPKSTLRVPAYK